MRKYKKRGQTERHVAMDRLISEIINITNLYRELKIIVDRNDKRLFTDDIILLCETLENRRRTFFRQTENQEHEYEAEIEARVQDELLAEESNLTGQTSRVNLTGYAPNVTAATYGDPEDFDPFFRCPVRACRRPYGIMSTLINHIEDEHRIKYTNINNMEQL